LRPFILAIFSLFALASPGAARADHGAPMQTPYYEREGVTLYHGDSRDVLRDVVGLDVDVLLTDPPYGMDWRPKGKHKPIANDGRREALPLLDEVLALTAPHLRADAHAYLFCHWASWPGFFELAQRELKVANALIWWKQQGGMGDTKCAYAPDYEVILYGIRGRRALEGPRDGAVLDDFRPVPAHARSHPTEKPVALLRYLLGKSAPPAGQVLDPFAGSGATLVAAAELGLTAVGIELDEAYCEAAAWRISAALQARHARLHTDLIVADDPAIMGVVPPGRGYTGLVREDRRHLHGWYAVVDDFGGTATIYRPALIGERIPDGALVHVLQLERGMVFDSRQEVWRGRPRQGNHVHAVAAATIRRAA